MHRTIQFALLCLSTCWLFGCVESDPVVGDWEDESGDDRMHEMTILGSMTGTAGMWTYNAVESETIQVPYTIEVRVGSDYDYEIDYTPDDGAYEAYTMECNLIGEAELFCFSNNGLIGDREWTRAY